MSDLDRYTRTLERGLSGEPNPDPPPAWLGWILVCLCRQRSRQSWLRWVAETRLEDVDDDEGPVPGLPEWSYEYHGQGLCLSGPGNEHLDVDFHDAQCATIDPFFFAWRVLRLDPASAPEEQLQKYFADAQSLALALEELWAAGVLVHETSEHVFRLAPPIEAIHERVASVDFDSSEHLEQWRRALGDGPEALTELVAWVERRCKDRQGVSSLRRTVEQQLPEDSARRIFEGCLSGPVDAPLGYAVEALHRMDADPEPIRAVLGRLNPARHHPFPAYAVCRFLLHRDLERERALATVASFADVKKVKGYGGNPYSDHLALLLLEFDPPRALPYVRRALRESTPASVQRVSATLAAIGQSWCVRELTAALEDTAVDGTNRRYLAAALGQIGEVAAQRAKALEPPAPVHEGPGYSFDEVVFANMGAFFGRALAEARPLAERLRAILPDDYGSPK